MRVAARIMSNIAARCVWRAPAERSVDGAFEAGPAFFHSRAIKLVQKRPLEFGGSKPPYQLYTGGKRSTWKRPVLSPNSTMIFPSCHYLFVIRGWRGIFDCL